MQVIHAVGEPVAVADRVLNTVAETVFSNLHECEDEGARDSVEVDRNDTVR